MEFIYFIIAFVLVVAWIAYPFFKSSREDYVLELDDTVDTLKNLQQQRSSLMLTIRELDFDYETGKLSKEDYVILRKKYEQETIDTLKRIEIEMKQWEVFETRLDKKLAKKA